jgi:hypothetical protein
MQRQDGGEVHGVTWQETALQPVVGGMFFGHLNVHLAGLCCGWRNQHCDPTSRGKPRGDEWEFSFCDWPARIIVELAEAVELRAWLLVVRWPGSVGLQPAGMTVLVSPCSFASPALPPKVPTDDAATTQLRSRPLSAISNI